MKPDEKKSLSELEEVREHQDAEITVAQQRLLLKEVEARGASVEAFREGGRKGGINFRRIINWLKTH